MVAIRPIKSTQRRVENRTLASTADDRLDVGMALFDSDLQLTAWNHDFFELLELPVAFAQRGRPYEDFLRFAAARGQLSLGETERQTIRLIDQAHKAQPYREDWVRRDAGTITTVTAPLYGGGVIRVCARKEADEALDRFLRQHAAVAARAEVLDALDCMADGFALFDRDDRLMFCNERYREYHPVIADRLLPGSRYKSLLRDAFALGQYSSEYESAESLLKLRKDAIRGRRDSFEIQLGDGRWLHCSETSTSDGNTVSIRSEITELKRREAELTRLSEVLKVQNLHFDTALNNMAQGLCLFDSDQRLIVCNQRYLDMYGFSPEVVKPGIRLRDIMEYSISLGNYRREEAERALAERPSQAAQREQSIIEQRLRDGRVIAVLHQPMAGGGSVATYEDITARAQAEVSLHRHAEALERRNRELQEFAYVASHDLQEPLRKIQAFSDRLVKKCGDQVNEDGQLYIGRIQDAAARMHDLINDLLTYSRVTTRTEPFEPIDLNKVVAEVLSDLEIRIAETEAVVKVAALPHVEASAVQMRQLFQNLISNALKFRRDGVPARVDITAEPVAETEGPAGTADACRIRIADNGIGFDEKYAEQIFGIFQRLHGRGSYEGTGIGLATCRKIVERHNGAIEARGVEGEGATFILTLPLKHEQGSDTQ